MVNDFTLNCRHIFNHSLLFAISDKHSGLKLNFLCCLLYFELGLSCVVHALSSDFKLFQGNKNLELSLG